MAALGILALCDADARTCSSVLSLLADSIPVGELADAYATTRTDLQED